MIIDYQIRKGIIRMRERVTFDYSATKDFVAEFNLLCELMAEVFVFTYRAILFFSPKNPITWYFFL